MALEDLQLLWNSQTQEKQYLINEDALLEIVRLKGGKVKKWLDFGEWVMLLANLAAPLVLMIDGYRDGDWYNYLLSAVYLLCFLVFWVRRRARQHEEAQRFPLTIVGELDKAIWQSDYLMAQNRATALWYPLAFLIILGVLMFFEQRLFWAWLLMLAVLPAGYYGTLWENRRFHLPRKLELVALRERLLRQEENYE